MRERICQRAQPHDDVRACVFLGQLALLDERKRAQPQREHGPACSNDAIAAGHEALKSRESSRTVMFSLCVVRVCSRTCSCAAR